MNDEDGAAPGYEETQPLSTPLSAPLGPPPSWTPPPSYPPPGSTAPLPESSSPAHLEPVSARPAGWMWPAIAVIALVLGLTGGVAGSVIYNRTSDQSSDGRTSQGLNTSSVQTAAPIKGGKSSVAAVAQ